MLDCKIIVMRKAHYDDLMQKYENPLEHACDVSEGQVFISRGGQKPEGLCPSAWESMERFVQEIAAGGGDFYDGWRRDSHSAMISCNDGFRPVSFFTGALGGDHCF